MANEQLAPVALPRAPSSDTDVRALSRWARLMQQTGSIAFARIINALNQGSEISGEWSPGISGDTTSGSANYGHRRGRWTLQGQDVSLWGDVLVNSFNGVPIGNLRIHGLPFIHETAAPGSLCLVLVRSGLTLTEGGYTSVTGVIQTNSQTIRFLEWGSGLEAQLVQAETVETPLRLEIYASYRKRADEVATPAP